MGVKKKVKKTALHMLNRPKKVRKKMAKNDPKNPIFPKNAKNKILQPKNEKWAQNLKI